jgi:O-antigen ligase
VSRRLALAAACAIVLLAPLGEGGRAPLALFVLHTLSLVCVCLAGAAPRLPGSPPAAFSDPLRGVPLLAGAGIGLALVSALCASYPLAAELGACDLVVPFLLFVSMKRVVPEDRALETLLLVVLASTSVQALLAVARYPAGGANAAGAMFLNPNHLAAFLNLGFFLVLVRFLRPARPRARLAWGALALLHLAAIIVLESRGAFAALIITLVAFLFLGRQNLPRPLFGIAGGLVVFCALAAALVLSARFSRDIDPYRYTRVSIWRAGATMITDRPLLGFGPGMFPHVSARFNFPSEVGPIRYGRDFQGAHSALLTFAAEAGVPAAALILTAIVLTLVVLLRARPGEEPILGVGLGLLALAIQGLVEDLAVRPALTLVPALLAGAVLERVRRRRDPGERPGPGHSLAVEAPGIPRPEWFVGATLATYAFFAGVLLPFWADREAREALRLGRSGLPRMERAALLNPLHPDYRNDLAMAILNSGPLSAEGYARASSELIEARRLKPIDYRFPLHLARLEARYATRLFHDAAAMGRAASLYREAVRLTPLDPRPRLELAGHLVDLKLREEALQVLGDALVLEPNFVRARLLQASIYLDDGRREEALASLRQAERTLEVLRGFAPDSGYAAEIALDARAERERLAAVLETPGRPEGRS